MERVGGIFGRIALAMAGKRSPWGNAPKGDGGSGEDGEDSPPSSDKPDDNSGGPRNPWLPGGSDNNGDDRRRSARIEDIFKNRGPEGPRRNTGGPRGPNFRIPTRPGGKSWFPIIGAVIVGLWLLLSSVHQISPREQGLVTWLGGKYNHTLNSGLNFTLPWPIQSVDKENVQEIRSETIPEGDTQKLILTGDQNLVDLTYLIRWNIGDLKLYRYRLADPNDTVREAAETAMRQSVAEQELDTVLSGEGRAEIEQNVRTRMQAILDSYQAGVTVQGVEIDKTDPPESVVDAFKDVSAAEQDAQAEMNRARRYAQQLLARAEGDAAAFDKIYEEYRLAPEVTRRRLYYETMESVLSKTDKTVIEADGVTPYLPLPEIKRRSQQSATAAAQQDN